MTIELWIISELELGLLEFVRSQCVSAHGHDLSCGCGWRHGYKIGLRRNASRLAASTSHEISNRLRDCDCTAGSRVSKCSGRACLNHAICDISHSRRH